MNARIATYTDFIPTSDILNQSWQHQLANLVTDIDELCNLLSLNKDELLQTYQLPPKFPLQVPHAFVAKMTKGDLSDPLLLQILPTKSEQIQTLGYITDPLDEHNHNPIKGLLHKYQSRVLITLTGACAVHCRYCFRQHFDYNANLPKSDEQAQILDYINKNPDINEVLLSGGDPLNVSNRRLLDWLSKLADCANITTIRLHTRLPIVLPARIDDELLNSFKNLTKNIVMVIHTNHPSEIDDDVKIACTKLKSAGVTLLNQTVLLKNINDNAETLANLSHKLFGIGVLPYYLHILDKVQGASHFDIDESQAIELYWQLLEKLSGYLVPKLVQELPNRPYKTPIDIYKSSAFE